MILPMRLIVSPGRESSTARNSSSDGAGAAEPSPTCGDVGAGNHRHVAGLGLVRSRRRTDDDGASDDTGVSDDDGTSDPTVVAGAVAAGTVVGGAVVGGAVVGSGAVTVNENAPSIGWASAAWTFHRIPTCPPASGGSKRIVNI